MVFFGKGNPVVFLVDLQCYSAAFLSTVLVRLPKAYNQNRTYVYLPNMIMYMNYQLLNKVLKTSTVYEKEILALPS